MEIKAVPLRHGGATLRLNRYVGYSREKRRSIVESLGKLPKGARDIPPEIAQQLTPKEAKQLRDYQAAAIAEQQAALVAGLPDTLKAAAAAIRGGAAVGDRKELEAALAELADSLK